MAVTQFRKYGTKAVPKLLEKVNILDIINDLTTGGTGVPLSAEQGKILASLVSSGNTGVQQAIIDLIGGASADYDTLGELEAIIKANKLASETADATESAARIAGDDTVRGEFAAADTVIADSVTQEVADRIAADDAEIALRVAGDDALSGRLDVVEGDDTVVGSIKQAVKVEADARIAADDAEVTLRIAGDTALGGRIDNEIADRTASNGVLQTALDAEISRAQGAETINTDNLATEVAARISGDNLLDGRLDIIESGLVAGIRWMAQYPAISDLDTLDPAATEAGWGYFISNEKDVYVAINSENGDYLPTTWVGSGKSFIKFADFAEITGMVSTEKNRAELAEAALQASIDSEAASRVQGDADVSANLTTEVARAQAAEQANANAISQEVTDRAAAVLAEETARTNADTTLQIALDAEVLRSTTEDTDHGTRLTTLEGPSTVDGSVAKAVEDEAVLRAAADAQEVINRTAGDDAVQANLDAVEAAASAALSTEATTRGDADTALSGRLDIIEGTAVGSITEAKLAAEQTAYDYILRPKVEGIGGTLLVVGDTITVAHNITDGINGLVWGEAVVYAGDLNSEALAVNVSSVANNVITLATSVAGEFDGKSCKVSYFYRAISNTGAGTGLAGEGLTS